MHRLRRISSFRAFQVTVSGCETQVSRGVYRHSTRVRIEPNGVEVPTVLIRLSAVECRAFELPGVSEQPGGEHTKTHVRGILPVMTDRSGWVVHRGGAMHKGYRAESGLTGRGRVETPRQRFGDGVLVQRAQLHPEIVRMLPVVQRLTFEALAALKKQRVP